MRCPLDDAPLREVTRRGVKVDICPECRGIWLDRGELEHLLDAATDADAEFDRHEENPLRSAVGDRGHEENPLRDARRESRYRDDDDDDDDYRRRESRGKRRKNWLSEIFEFGE